MQCKTAHDEIQSAQRCSKAIGYQLSIPHEIKQEIIKENLVTRLT